MKIKDNLQSWAHLKNCLLYKFARLFGAYTAKVQYPYLLGSKTVVCVLHPHNNARQEIFHMTSGYIGTVHVPMFEEAELIKEMTTRPYEKFLLWGMFKVAFGATILWRNIIAIILKDSFYEIKAAASRKLRF